MPTLEAVGLDAYIWEYRDMPRSLLICCGEAGEGGNPAWVQGGTTLGQRVRAKSHVHPWSDVGWGGNVM